MLSSVASAQNANQTNNADVVNARDIIRLLSRVELYQSYVEPSDNIGSWATTLRFERAFLLQDSWKFSFRFESSFVYSNDGTGEFQGYRGSLGDVLAQAAFSKEIDSRLGIGFGLRMTAPTASDAELGTGRWILLPTVGFQYKLPEISDGSYFQTVVRKPNPCRGRF